jgi:serine/threonine protein kinase
MGLESLLTGHLLCDRYRVDRVIGRGGMGAVYRATDVRLERAVAVKVITAAGGDISARDRLRARFHREARAAARLQHPNVVTVHDFGTDSRLDLDFLVMELLRGEDLARRLGRCGPPDPATALELMEQASRGVAAGHTIGLVHRDLKPANLFLSDAGSGGRVCVLDFGIVQLSAEAGDEATSTQLTMIGRAPHSPAFAAPEQLRGDDRIGAPADVWALGATAFLLLTGTRPFDETAQRRMMDGATLPAPSARARAPHVPEHLDDLLRVALAQHPADRFRDAGALAAALADARRRGAAFATAGAAASDAWRTPAARAAEEDATLLETDSTPTRAVTLAARGAPEPMDHTLLDPTSERRHGPSLEEMPRPNAAPVSLDDPHVAPRRGGRLRRAASAVWSFAVTVASVAVVGLFGYAMFESFLANLTEPFYASVAGFTVSLPWAVYRLAGRQGSYPLALVGSVVAAIAVFRLVAPLAGPEGALIALGPAQLLTCGGIVRLTRRRAAGLAEPPELPARLSA